MSGEDSEIAEDSENGGEDARAVRPYAPGGRTMVRPYKVEGG